MREEDLRPYFWQQFALVKCWYKSAVQFRFLTFHRVPVYLASLYTSYSMSLWKSRRVWLRNEHRIDRSENTPRGSCFWRSPSFETRERPKSVSQSWLFLHFHRVSSLWSEAKTFLQLFPPCLVYFGFVLTRGYSKCHDFFADDCKLFTIEVLRLHPPPPPLSVVETTGI